MDNLLPCAVTFGSFGFCFSEVSFEGTSGWPIIVVTESWSLSIEQIQSKPHSFQLHWAKLFFLWLCFVFWLWVLECFHFQKIFVPALGVFRHFMKIRKIKYLKHCVSSPFPEADRCGNSGDTQEMERTIMIPRVPVFWEQWAIDEMSVVDLNDRWQLMISTWDSYGSTIKLGCSVFSMTHLFFENLYLEHFAGFFRNAKCESAKHQMMRFWWPVYSSFLSAQGIQVMRPKVAADNATTTLSTSVRHSEATDLVITRRRNGHAPHPDCLPVDFPLTKRSKGCGNIQNMGFVGLASGKCKKNNKCLCPAATSARKQLSRPPARRAPPPARRAPATAPPAAPWPR